MSRPAHPRLPRAFSTFLLLTACLLPSAGCHNTCISGTLNAPGSVINVKVADPPPSCTLATAKGVVHLEIGAAAGPITTSSAIGPYVSHLFVALSGVDAHPSASANDDSPGWQPLAPQLQAYPLQLDLLAHPQVNRSAALSDAVVPAGIYWQIRLRFAASLPNQPDPGELMDEPGLEANRCGAGALHCAVPSNGTIQPLVFSPSASSLRIPGEGPRLASESQTDTFSGHGLYVPPDGVVTLSIELNRERSLLWPSGSSFLLDPVFHLIIPPHPAFPDS